MNPRNFTKETQVWVLDFAVLMKDLELLYVTNCFCFEDETLKNTLNHGSSSFMAELLDTNTRKSERLKKVVI